MSFVQISIYLSIYVTLWLLFTEEPYSSLFHEAVLDDHMTTLDEWNELVHLLQDRGYYETAMSLLAAITVLGAMKNALRTSHEEFSKIQPPRQNSET